MKTRDHYDRFGNGGIRISVRARTLKQIEEKAEKKKKSNRRTTYCHQPLGTCMPTHLKPSPMAVAVDHHHHHNFKPWKRRRRLFSFPHPDASLLDVAIPASRDRNFHRSLSTPCFYSTTPEDHHPDINVARVEILGSSCRSHAIHSLVVEAAIALASGAVPVPASSGLGGAYFLRNHRSGECFAVVKPIDRPGSWLSVRAGETGLREVAAYLLDHGGFSGVPPTALIEISHPALQSDTTLPPQRKIASIQRFVPHDFDAGDLGPSRFSVASIHRIGILDVRLLNIDRHAGNLLVRKHVVPNVESSGCGGNDSVVAELVPIDHGLCLPELLDDPYFEWLHWPQAAVPFSGPEAEYISSLDPFKDAELLHSELPSLRESAVRILILCTIFLKRAAASELCLAEIGSMMTREFFDIEDEPSALEALCKRAELDSISLRRSSTISYDGDDSGGDEDDMKEFQFEMDCGGGEECSEKYMQEVLGLPLLLRSKGNEGGECEEEGSDGVLKKLGSSTISKSMSLSAADLNAYECGGHGGSKCSGSISFKGMSEEQWGLFLERFEELLPEVFEARKSMGLGGLKHRLGTSCKLF